MKRFRLTHQQTRFLMSEFAKQPHPDAAHRERLSREIPGLSPRQVQVWFQNRRAKIKRLTADDRERLIKMRAVPEDFDSVQALHSPYGAVRGLGAPVDFGPPGYADHMVPPLMVDVRRPERDDHHHHHMSPTGLSPAFGNIRFGPPATMSSPDLLSPMSPSANDPRYGYGSHASGPLGARAPRQPNVPVRQGSLDQGMMHNRQQARPLQPLHLRDTLSRTRSENLQSPLRSGMSWKGDSIDYTAYSGGSASPPAGVRPQPVYQAEHMNSNTPGGGLGGFDSSYSGHAIRSPSNINYPSYQPPNMPQTSQSKLRGRASSATFPLGPDLRSQYRHHNTSIQSPGSHATAADDGGSGTTPQTVSTTAPQFGGVPSVAAYPTGFPSAPLTAPLDFSYSRTHGNGVSEGRQAGGTVGGSGDSNLQDYSMPQLSAPLAPPGDFSQAFHSGSAANSARTPMRESFGASHPGSGERPSGDGYGSSDFGVGPSLKRKRSFTMPVRTPTSGPGSHAYNNPT
ncbi:hypothetical protein ACRALDRAFT_1073549 [Sodiomyces alcalophilus JCM 7366]|uniref:uncharacterized protein n=1 Tax=Sodiomyces alcalophilus JCM 7366 TaxID=591952 RepID=UPI0039B4FF9D